MTQISKFRSKFSFSQVRPGCKCGQNEGNACDKTEHCGRLIIIVIVITIIIIIIVIIIIDIVIINIIIIIMDNIIIVKLS